MTSDEARVMWERIAAGDRAVDADAFVRQVARQVLDTVFVHHESANRRAEAAQKAVGFVGRLSANEWGEFDRFTQEAGVADAPPAFVAGLAPLLVDVPQSTVDQRRKRVSDIRRRRKR